MTNRYKTRKSVSTAIDLKIYEEFQKLVDRTRIPASRLHDEALADLIEKYKKQGEKEA